MPEQRRRRGEAGFTLVEVLIALTIFVIGLLAICEMQITSISATTFSHTISTANNVASGVLDEILSWESDDARLSVDSVDNVWDFDPLTAGVQGSVTLEGAGNYTATYSIDANAPVDKVATITVVVRGGAAGGTLRGAGERQRTLIGLKRIQ